MPVLGVLGMVAAFPATPAAGAAPVTGAAPVVAEAPSPPPAPTDGATAGGTAARWSVAPANAKGPDGRTVFSYSGLRPGAVVHDFLSITNRGSAPVTFRVYAADAITTVDGSIGVAAADVKPTDVGAWAGIAHGSVRVAARTRVIEPFTITVPVNATPGDHVGGVIASITERPAGGTVIREDRFAVAAYLRVDGALAPALGVESVSTSYHGTANPFGGGDATVSYTVRNTGNVRLGGTQTVSITGLFGTEASTHPAALEELLPGDSVRVTVRLPGVAPAGPLTAHVTVVPVERPNAPRAPAAPKPAARSASLWATPWPQLVLLLIVLAAGAGVWWWLRWNRRRRTGQLAAALEQGRRAAAAEQAVTVQSGIAPAVRASVATRPSFAVRPRAVLLAALAGCLGAFALASGAFAAAPGLAAAPPVPWPARPALAAPAAAPGVHADGSGGQHVTVTIPQHSTPPTQQSLACTGAGGTTLGDNPTLHPGDQLSCTGSGFGAGERVGVTLSPPARDLGTVTAGSDGAARDTVSLPAELGAGPHTLTFTGQTDHGTASFAFTVTIVATVPVSGGGSAGSGGGGWLPRTGTNLLSLASTGAGLVIVGLLGMVAARRRRRDAVLGVLPEGERG